MVRTDTQLLFFQHIKNKIPPYLSLVQETADLLNISSDSAYRRIRGEKGLYFDEIRALCSHFKISLDQIFNRGNNSILFSDNFSTNRNFTFDNCLENILKQLLFMNLFEKRELIGATKDIPIFHLFNFGELAAFRIFFWMKSLLKYHSFERSSFSTNDFTESLHSYSQKIVAEYNKLDSQEIWTIESFYATIQQIEYYKDTKAFSSAEDIFSLYDALQKTIDHIEKQAEKGFKFTVNGMINQPQAEFKLYVNEFILGDHTLLALLNDTKVAYLNNSVLNIMATRDNRFTDYTHCQIRNITSKSTLISNVGEKQRKIFFNVMREKILRQRKVAANYTK